MRTGYNWVCLDDRLFYVASGVPPHIDTYVDLDGLCSTSRVNFIFLVVDCIPGESLGTGR